MAAGGRARLEQAARDTVPQARSEADRQRHQVQAQRYRLLTGAWVADAALRQAEFFADEVLQYLPAPEISRNPFLRLALQISSLCDEPPAVAMLDDQEAATPARPAAPPPPKAPPAPPGAPPAPVPPPAPPEPEDEPPVELVYTDRLKAQLPEHLLLVCGVQESAIRLDWRPGGTEVEYRLVPGHALEATHPMPHQPDVLGACEERREREIEGRLVWTWDVWDCRNPAAPVFRIERCREGSTDDREDVTATFWTAPEGATGLAATYPYVDKAGAPIFPYVLGHKQVGTTLWSPLRGQEAVLGTLTVACLWTMWVGGLRDGAHPQRVVLNGRVLGKATPRPMQAGGGGGGGVEYIPLNPMMLLQVVDAKDGVSAGIDQFQPAMEPQTVGQAISAFERDLALFAGVQEDDLQRSAGQSGYAIVLSREGQRRAQRRLEPPTRISLQLVLATAARIANAYAEGQPALAEEPERWQLRFPTLRKSAEEVKADLEEVDALLSAKLIGRIEAYQRVHSHESPTRDEALDALAEIDLQEDEIRQRSAALRVERGLPPKREAPTPPPAPPGAGAAAPPAPPGTPGPTPATPADDQEPT